MGPITIRLFLAALYVKMSVGVSKISFLHNIMLFIFYRRPVNTVSKCYGVYVMFRCMHCLGVDACWVVDGIFGCLCNVWVLTQCSGVYAMFGC